MLFSARTLGTKIRSVCIAVGAVLTGAGVASSAPFQSLETGYWHTSGNQILDTSNAPVRIAGINWYGFETPGGVVHGLTSQDYKTILDTIKTQGYNTLRIPLSNQIVERPVKKLNISYYNTAGPINTDLDGLNSMEVLDKIVHYAGKIGLKVILDNHRSEAGDGAQANGLWYTANYPESAWIEDWAALARRYKDESAVIGFDLRNEPHNADQGGACWDCGGANDWHLAAERAGDAILDVNPKLLIFVEGVDTYNNDRYWWGGNLEGVAKSPVVLSESNQLVYSAHEYGPRTSGQTWFNASTNYGSLSAVWDRHWAYISKQGKAPVWLGEFGTTNDTADIVNRTAGSEGQWFQSLVRFLDENDNLNWTCWALNGEDPYGLLNANYDAQPASALKQSAMARIQSPVGGKAAHGANGSTSLTASAERPSLWPW